MKILCIMLVKPGVDLNDDETDVCMTLGLNQGTRPCVCLPLEVSLMQLTQRLSSGALNDERCQSRKNLHNFNIISCFK